MTVRSFLDTNVLLYAYDPSDRIKRRVALAIMEGLSISRCGVISTQVLGEFFSVATRKFHMPAATAYARLAHFVQAFDVAGVTPDIVLEAARDAIRRQINFWDAQLLAVARAERIPVILSEDLQDGAVLDGVRIVNPFRADLVT